MALFTSAYARLLQLWLRLKIHPGWWSDAYSPFPVWNSPLHHLTYGKPHFSGVPPSFSHCAQHSQHNRVACEVAKVSVDEKKTKKKKPICYALRFLLWLWSSSTTSWSSYFTWILHIYRPKMYTRIQDYQHKGIRERRGCLACIKEVTPVMSDLHPAWDGEIPPNQISHFQALLKWAAEVVEILSSLWLQLLQVSKLTKT